MSDTSPRNQDALRWDAPKRKDEPTPIAGERLWTLIRGTRPDSLAAESINRGPAYGFELRILHNGEFYSAERCETRALITTRAEQHRVACVAAGWSVSRP